MRMNGCTKCEILRFQSAAGMNDKNFADDIIAYANIEEAARGYNAYKASPNDALDDGFSDYLVEYNWAITKKDSTNQVYPSENMELHKLISCDGSADVTTKILADASSFQSAAMDFFSNFGMLTKEKSLFGSASGGGGGYSNGDISKKSVRSLQTKFGTERPEKRGGWFSRAWKGITKPFRNLGRLISGKLPKINANANIITPDYKTFFKGRLFGKLNL